MDVATIRQITRLNQDFYTTVGPIWNSNLNYYWLGWQQLIPHFKNCFSGQDHIRILDIGCGNGRFGYFLGDIFGFDKIIYSGIDNTPLYTEDLIIDPRFAEYTITSADLANINWKNNLPHSAFDLVVGFGVLHHIPGIDRRKNVVRECSQLVDSNGLLVVTSWQFIKNQRLLKRVVDIKQDARAQSYLSSYNINIDKLEENDFLLDWVKIYYALRYAHNITPQEMYSLFPFDSFNLVSEYEDDDRTRNRNRYFVFQNK